MVYVEFLQIAKRKPNQKLSKILTFHRRGKNVAKKLCSATLAIKELQIKTAKKENTVLYPFRWQKSRSLTHCWRVCGSLVSQRRV